MDNLPSPTWKETLWSKHVSYYLLRSVLLHQLLGTICQNTCLLIILVMANSFTNWRRSCSLKPTRERRLWERSFERCFISRLTYLLFNVVTKNSVYYDTCVHSTAHCVVSVRRCLSVCLSVHLSYSRVLRRRCRAHNQVVNTEV